ncbi:MULTISPECIES: hypothetical protein [Sorangium]|uniref:Uncharacterized protein n=2 Tax=Sorangium cellulosum TaxID=56 RepID=A0A4P2QUE9_SORCE|nr:MULTISPECIES: hypothetical protein [Sorangium]AUX33999.1 hypothetical protein SOCE836_061670 [Sorangium cellulosum]WCQ93309.1 hypothetical protein NQZ70_06057 [Sorangium sp. Soce836]
MARAFSVAALAIAEGGANAVGAVRFTCAEAELEVELVRVAGYAEGFALGAVAAPVRFGVPYTAIRGLFRRGKALCVALDPSACSPHNCFVLARFEGDLPGVPGVISPTAMEAMESAYRARVHARVASWVAPAPLGVLAAALSPDYLASGPLGTASLALLVALATWLALRFAARLATWGGPPSDRLRDALVEELSRRMGFASERLAASTPGAPAPPVFAPRPTPLAARPGRERGGEDGLDALPLRARVLVPAALAVVGIVATMAFVQRFAAPRDLPPAERQAALGVGPAARGAAAALLAGEARERAEPSFPHCLCERADSPLWQQGVPILSVLGSTGPDDGAGVIAPILKRDRAEDDEAAAEPGESGAEPGAAASGDAGAAPGDAGVDGGGRARRPARGRYDFELAVVNNSGAPVRDFRVLLTFARRNRRGERAGITERGLFWEGALAPGRAVKWHVEAPGTEVKIEPGVTGMLDGETGVASPDAFFQLTRARYRVVRIHAAMMLAWLRDPRARDALLSLLPAASGEEEKLERIRRATADVVPCSVAVAEGRLRACLFNGGVAPLRGVTLREVAAGEGGAPRAWPIAATLPVHEGVEVTLPLEGSAAPEELEVVPQGR